MVAKTVTNGNKGQKSVTSQKKWGVYGILFKI